jgi:hypothetical protein
MTWFAINPKDVMAELTERKFHDMTFLMDKAKFLAALSKLPNELIELDAISRFYDDCKKYTVISLVKDILDFNSEAKKELTVDALQRLLINDAAIDLVEIYRCAMSGDLPHDKSQFELEMMSAVTDGVSKYVDWLISEIEDIDENQRNKF